MISKTLQKQLEFIEKKFQEVKIKINDPGTIQNNQMYIALSQEYKKYEKVLEEYEKMKKMTQEIQEAKTIIQMPHTEEDFKNMAVKECAHLIDCRDQTIQTLKKLLLPEDPNDQKNIVLEIRAGTGGDEAGIFAGNLFRMYIRFFEKKKWHYNMIHSIDNSAGGYKEIICEVSGKKVYGTMKFESGVHRVQRIPATETQGRVHTSAASVIVMPEVDDITVKINMNDIRKDTFCSSGPGGQSVNTTYSAIRLTHIPTGMVVSCQDEKSQLKNFDKAMKVLRARLYEKECAKRQETLSQERKQMVKTGDRSEKIRTYNYPQNRITDHRIKYTAHNLNAVMEGVLEELIEALKASQTMEENHENAS